MLWKPSVYLGIIFLGLIYGRTFLTRRNVVAAVFTVLAFSIFCFLVFVLYRAFGGR